MSVRFRARSPGGFRSTIERLCLCTYYIQIHEDLGFWGCKPDPAPRSIHPCGWSASAKAEPGRQPLETTKGTSRSKGQGHCSRGLCICHGLTCKRVGPRSWGPLGVSGYGHCISYQLPPLGLTPGESPKQIVQMQNSGLSFTASKTTCAVHPYPKGHHKLQPFNVMHF